MLWDDTFAKTQSSWRRADDRTTLHRTPLTTSQKVECAAKTLAGQEVHGTISAVSREFGLSRPTVYEVRDTAGEVLREHVETDLPPVCEQYLSYNLLN
jgi:hypothetical protein